MQYIDSHLEMESNLKVRAEMEYMSGKVYKKYRVFGKQLDKISEQMDEESGKREVRMEVMLLNPCE